MPSRMSSTIRLLVAGLVLSLALTACEEGPLGFELLERGEIEVHQLTLEPDTVISFSKEVALGEGPTIFGGKDSLTQARILLSIEGLDSLSAFDSVKLGLRRHQGLDQAQVRFNVHPLNAEWEEEGCTWVLADAYTPWKELGGEYEDTLLHELVVEEDTVEIVLDPAALATYRTGIVLIPQNEGFCYLGSDEKSTYAPYLLGFEDEDTTQFSTVAGSDYFARVHDATILEPYQAPSQDTLLGAGLAWRVYARFPVDTLPAKIDITSADLILDYENYFSPDTFLDFTCYRLINDYQGRFSDLSQAVAGRDSILYSSDSLGVSFVSVVQMWAEEPDSNFGLILSHSFLPTNPTFGQEKEIYALGRVAGVPRLVITYTDLPRTRFPGEDQ